MSEDSEEAGRRGWGSLRPWETASLPALVNIREAAKIIGVHESQVMKWCKPGSGSHLPWGGFGPDRTYMVPAHRLNGDEATPSGEGPRVWVRADVERFSADPALGRQRERASKAATKAK